MQKESPRGQVQVGCLNSIMYPSVKNICGQTRASKCYWVQRTH